MKSLRILCFSTLLAGLFAFAAGAADGPDPAQIVVAARGDISVSLADVDAQVMAMPKHMRASFLDSPRRIEELVERMLLDRQLAAWARGQGAEDETHFELMRRQAEDELLAKRARAINQDQILARMPDFEVLAREIFVAAPHRFRTPPSLTLEHILVRVEGRPEGEAMRLAEEARTALIEGQRSWEDIYSTYSDEATPQRRTHTGILTGVIPGAMEKPFEDAVFKLTSVGEVSEVIETVYGLHVVRLQQRIESQQMSFEDIKAELIEEQSSTFIRNEQSRFMAELANVPMEASQPVVAQLRTRYALAAEGVLAPAIDGSEVDEAEAPGND